MAFGLRLRLVSPAGESGIGLLQRLPNRRLDSAASRCRLALRLDGGPPWMSACWLPGAGPRLRPPCIQHRFLPRIATWPHGPCARRLQAPQRGRLARWAG
jgi:hypothetical protein